MGALFCVIAAVSTLEYHYVNVHAIVITSHDMFDMFDMFCSDETASS